MSSKWGLALLFGFFPIICTGKSLKSRLCIKIKKKNEIVDFFKIRPMSLAFQLKAFHIV